MFKFLHLLQIIHFTCFCFLMGHYNFSHWCYLWKIFGNFGYSFRSELSDLQDPQKWASSLQQEFQLFCKSNSKRISGARRADASSAHTYPYETSNHKSRAEVGKDRKSSLERRPADPHCRITVNYGAGLRNRQWGSAWMGSRSVGHANSTGKWVDGGYEEEGGFLLLWRTGWGIEISGGSSTKLEKFKSHLLGLQEGFGHC